MPDVPLLFMTVVVRFLQGLCEAAPTLVCGLFVAGYLRALVGPEKVRELLGAPGWRGIGRATLYGCLLPVCSIGVIPVLREMKRCGVPTSRLLSFALSAPLLNPLTVIYGLTALEIPIFLLIVGTTVAVSFLVGVVSATWYEAPLKEAPEPAPHAAWGLRRMTNVVLATAQAAAGPFWRDACVALVLSGVSAACFPPRFLSDHLPHQRPEAPVVAAAAALFSYVAPATGVMQVAAITSIQFSIGAAMAVHVFGVGLNGAALAWVNGIYGFRRLLSLGLLLALVTFGIGYAADAALPHPPSGEVDTYALDLYTRLNNQPQSVYGELTRTSLDTEHPAARLAAFSSLGMLAALTLLGIGFRLMKGTLLSDPPEATANTPTESAPWNRALPAPVLRLLGVGALIALLVQVVYIYYPPPKELFNEMSSVKADALSALNSRDWPVANRELGRWDYHFAKLPMAAALRGGARKPEHSREVAEARRILTELRIAAQQRREEAIVPLIVQIRVSYDACRECYLDATEGLAQ